MRNSVEGFTKIKKKTEQTSPRELRASWHSYVKERRAVVVDFPAVKPHWLGDNGQTL